MKIAVFHELHAGGALGAVNTFAEGLKKNHVVDLFLSGEISSNEKDAFTHVFTYPFNARKWQGGDWKGKLYKDTIELYKLAKLHQKIARHIDNKGYDLVFVHPSQYTQAPFILRFLKSKKIYYCQEPLRIVYDPLLAVDKKIKNMKQKYELLNRKLRKKIDEQNIQSADVILANSQNTQKNISLAYKLTSRVCYMGIDTQHFHPEIDSKSKEFDVLYIGARDQIDGFYLLQDALQLMKKKPKVYTHISGENWIEENAFAKLYASTKIVVCLASSEPFGLIPLEAMACGIPVIALNEGGYKESVIDGKTGYLISANANELAKKITALLSDEKRYKIMSNNARKEAVTNWTTEKSIRSLEKIFKDFLSQ